MFTSKRSLIGTNKKPPSVPARAAPQGNLSQGVGAQFVGCRLATQVPKARC